MTIQIELNPETMERLAAEAQAQGIPLGSYAENLLREAIATRWQSKGKLSVEELHAMLNAIADGADKLPKVATSDFARESFYQNRL